MVGILAYHFFMTKIRPKVLILGISGFLGRSIALRLRENFLVSGTYCRNPIEIPGIQTYPMNLKISNAMESIIENQSPDFTINAFSLTNYEAAASAAPSTEGTENPETMIALSLAMIAYRCKAKHIHLSCAEVYSGSKGNYSEDEPEFTTEDPLGKDKIAAESYIRAQTLESTILRVGKVAGIGLPNRPSYFDKMRISLEKGKEFSASEMKSHSFISAKSLGEAIMQVILGEFPMRHRTFNLGGPALNENEFCTTWAKLAGLDAGLVKEPDEGKKRNIAMKSNRFSGLFPNWKQENKAQMYLNLLEELSPSIGTKKWQKTLQTL